MWLVLSTVVSNVVVVEPTGNLILLHLRENFLRLQFTDSAILPICCYDMLSSEHTKLKMNTNALLYSP